MSLKMGAISAIQLKLISANINAAHRARTIRTSLSEITDDKLSAKPALLMLRIDGVLFDTLVATVDAASVHLLANALYRYMSNISLSYFCATAQDKARAPSMAVETL